jgi:membrane protein implicated in regulation of membrane protease activity
MSFQSLRERPILVGALTAAFMLVVLPLGMWMQGIPFAFVTHPSLLMQFAWAAVAFGLSMTLFAMLTRRTSQFLSTKTKQARLALIGSSLLLVGAFVFWDEFAAALSGRWWVVERQSGMALYLDKKSIRKPGKLTSFWTKMEPDRWLDNPWKVVEIRSNLLMDCRDETFRTLQGGIYVNGVLRFPHEKLSSGAIPKSGYMRRLHSAVC